MSDLLKVKVGGSSYLCKWTDNTVTVGNIAYKYVQVGSFYIITENLRYHTVDAYCYPNNDSSLESSMGLLYTAYSVFNEIIPILPTGWRVPSKNDFAYLYDNVARPSNKYISTIDGGSDDYGLNIRLCGYRNMNGIFTYFGEKCLLWSSTWKGDANTYNADFTVNSNMMPSDYSRGTPSARHNTALGVRIIKDV